MIPPVISALAELAKRGIEGMIDEPVGIGNCRRRITHTNPLTTRPGQVKLPHLFEGVPNLDTITAACSGSVYRSVHGKDDAELPRLTGCLRVHHGRNVWRADLAEKYAP